MVNLPTHKTVRQDHNKAKFYGFSCVTGATSSCIMSATQIQALGYNGIGEISIKTTNASGMMAFNKAATTTPGEDIVPLIQDTIITLEGIRVKDFSVIRSGSTDIKTVGYVVLY